MGRYDQESRVFMSHISLTLRELIIALASLNKQIYFVEHTQFMLENLKEDQQ
jgi:hypothetical protein